jgi:hypothetical protein
MLAIRPTLCAKELVMVGELPVERSAQRILLFALPG